MSIDDAVRTVAEKGFTGRQARFLVLVARHSGVFVMRQYSSFAGIVFGEKTRKFFAKLVRLGYVSTYDCAHNRARIYHLRHRDLYEAVGDPDSRLRRPPAVPRALERLMTLDAVLENPDIIWLSTPDEKVAHVSTLTRVPLDAMPRLKVRHGDVEQVRYFPDRLPVGIHPEGRWVFVCLMTAAIAGDFRGFLQRHVGLLSGLPAWTVRVALPAHLAEHGQGFLQHAWNQLATPLQAVVLDELRWYFEQLRTCGVRVGQPRTSVDSGLRTGILRGSVPHGVPSLAAGRRGGAEGRRQPRDLDRIGVRRGQDRAPRSATCLQSSLSLSMRLCFVKLPPGFSSFEQAPAGAGSS